MVSDLQNSTELVGMSADEVRELLGTPDYADTDTCLSYLIAQPFDEVTLDLTLEKRHCHQSGRKRPLIP